MAQAKPINLIQSKIRLSPQIEIAGELLHKISLWALGTLILTGVIVSGIFFYLQARQSQLTDTKNQLVSAIAQQTAKEGILFTLKHRVALVEKMFGVQKPVGQAIETVVGFIDPSALASVSLDDHNKAVVSIRAQSISQIAGMVSAVVKSASDGVIRVPQLLSFSLRPGGAVDVTISFVAVL